MNAVAIGIDVSATRFAIAAYSPGKIALCFMQRLTAGRQYELIREAVRDMHSEVPEPTAVGIEQPWFGRFPKAAYLHGMSVARAEDACRAQWRHAPIRFYQPKEWRRLSGVGGGASKGAVAEFAVELGFLPKNQDEADAALVAAACFFDQLEGIR